MIGKYKYREPVEAANLAIRDAIMASEITEEEAVMYERPSHEQRRVLGELSHGNARTGERGGFSRSFKPWLDRK